MVPQEREMRYTIMTPTLQRPELLRACESVNNQTCKDWEHLVIFDGEFKDKELLAKIVHPQRKVMKCLVPEGHSHSYGHPCKHYAWPEAQGDYLFNLDDDNYLLHDGVFEDLKQVTGVWAIFPMLYFGKRFLNDPPGLGLTASENFLVKREMGQWPDRLEYAADGYLVAQLKSKYPYLPKQRHRRDHQRGGPNRERAQRSHPPRHHPNLGPDQPRQQWGRSGRPAGAGG